MSVISQGQEASQHRYMAAVVADHIRRRLDPLHKGQTLLAQSAREAAVAFFQQAGLGAGTDAKLRNEAASTAYGLVLDALRSATWTELDNAYERVAYLERCALLMQRLRGISVLSADEEKLAHDIATMFETIDQWGNEADYMNRIGCGCMDDGD